MPTSGRRSGRVLRGRRRECAALDRLVDDLHRGRSAVLVLRGEPGVGKSVLLDYVLEQPFDGEVARVGGVESEMEIAFAGLHQLCAPMLARLDHLPAPQRNALRTVFGLQEGSRAPDRFLVGLAVLTLLSDMAAERPLICLVDDVQWLDRASVAAMAFAARRLLADPVALVFAVREPSDEHELDGLPDLVVEGLGDRDARLLLASALPGPFDPRVRDRIIAETRGNPLALVEVPRGSTPAELAAGFGVTDPGTLTHRIERSFARRLESLPGPTRRLLLTAAAEPLGDASLLWRAAERLDIHAEAARPAVADGLVELGARVRFRHPLVRSAVYRSASSLEREVVHAALADVTDPEADPDRRAWHRAHAAAGPDEAVAAELEHSAARAQRRGGMAAAAAFLARATELTPDPGRRGERAVAAAQAAFEAGSLAKASELLATAELGPLDELQRGRVERLRARLIFTRTRGSEALRPLLEAARRLQPLDADLARETYLEAVTAAAFASRLVPAGQMREVVDAARRAPLGTRPIDLLLVASLTSLAEGPAASVAANRRALDAFRRDADEESTARWLWFAARTAVEVWDDDAWHELATRQVLLARETGALTVLTVALTMLAMTRVHAGDFAGTAALVDEAEVLSEITGNAVLTHPALLLAAWRGDEEQARHALGTIAQDATVRGEGRAIAAVQYGTAILENGLGRYDAALTAAGRAAEHDEPVVSSWALVEQVEAAARIGLPDVATAALRRLAARTRVSGTDWALGIEARSRALVSDGADADRLYREAVERLGRTRATAHLARAHLVHGEWLRRERRRADAREQLGIAHEMFERMGAHAFAERARRELLITGVVLGRRQEAPREGLTAQEAQVARLARDGLTNPEIGAQLYLSHHTVEWHLRKVFSKLGISSRRELARALS
jgi:DNA-binding CsgD family transcriptional regulator